MGSAADICVRFSGENRESWDGANESERVSCVTVGADPLLGLPAGGKPKFGERAWQIRFEVSRSPPGVG